MPMTDKKKGKHSDQVATKPTKAKKDELSQKDLDKASGGITWTWTDGGEPTK
jgi:hypothetical protein